MEFKSRREARFLLIKDSLNAIAQRLGYLNQEELNNIGQIGIGDGYFVTINSSAGIGMKIRHTMEVSILDNSLEYAWRFTIDVLGKNQCKNCYFPGLPNFGRDVDHLSDDDWEDLKWLPELFADAVHEILYTRFQAK